MSDLPAGIVTFLFTDLEGSTRFWEEHPDLMPAVYDRHDAILRQVISAHSGVIYKVIGDAIQAAFPTPEAGVGAAIAAQQLLIAEKWPLAPAPLVRMALHVAQIDPDATGDFRSPLLNRLGRLLSAAEGGQVLLSADLVSLLGSPKDATISVLDLGEHRFRDLTPQRVFQAVAPGIPADRARLLALSPHRTNLIAPTTSLVGREREISHLSDLLCHNSPRLVTLLGPGGVGKTRLAQAVAAEVLEEFSDGVWYVSLDTVLDPGDLPGTIASAVGIREGAGPSLLEAVSEHFSNRHSLLVLDNFEQLVDASGIVAALLRDCPRLKVLVTSRLPLDLSAEVEFLVLPLSIDESAVDLFVERYRAVQPAFRSNPESRAIVVQICRRLDGLPLAIELAAARGRMLPVEKLLSRLEMRLPLLTGGPRDAAARHRTLQTTIAWSVDLLGPGERAVFAGMSIFTGGAAIDALDPVLGGLVPSDGSSLDAFGSVEILVRHSLLKVDAAGRVTMLETIREYAAALLQQSIEASSLRAAHAVHYCDVVIASQPLLIDANQAETLKSLNDDWENIRQALSYFETQGPVATFAAMATALWRFWSIRGLYREGRRWLDSAIRQARSNELGGSTLAAALDGAGILAESQGDASEAEILHFEALNIWRAENDTTGIARSLENLGILALHSRGDLVLSREFHSDALHHFERMNDRRGVASSLKSLADVALFNEEFSDARALYAQSLTIVRSLHDSRGIAAGLTSLGALAFLEGDAERAIEHYEEAVAYWRLLDDVPGIALCVGNLGEALTFTGRVEESARLLAECLELSRTIGDQQGIAFALTHLGGLARSHDVRMSAQHYAEAAELSRSIGDDARLAEAVEGLAGALLDAGNAEMAARLFGVAQAIRGQSGIALPGVHGPTLAKDLAGTEHVLGSVKFSALAAEGLVSDLDALLPTRGRAELGERVS